MAHFGQHFHLDPTLCTCDPLGIDAVGIAGDRQDCLEIYHLRPIQRAANGQATPVEDVGVDHRGLHVLVAEEFLDGANIVVSFQ